MNLTRLLFILLCIPVLSFGQGAKKLPAINAIHAYNNSSQLLNTSLPSKGKLMLIFYDPGCGHCQELGANIAKQVDRLSKTSIYFICMNDQEYVDSYINMYAKGLRGKKNISFWKDPGVEFIEKFQPKNYPATYIYDAGSKSLVQDFQGEPDVKKMLSFLN